jgi:hypothetical protein
MISSPGIYADAADSCPHGIQFPHLRFALTLPPLKGAPQLQARIVRIGLRSTILQRGHSAVATLPDYFLSAMPVQLLSLHLCACAGSERGLEKKVRD